MGKFDVRMQVMFCNKHKKVFETVVKVFLSDGRVGIRVKELNSLWIESGTCVDCEWKTTFGK